MKPSTPLTLMFLLLSLSLNACTVPTSQSAARRIKQMEARDYFDETAQIALADAVAKGDLSRAQQAIERGADVNQIGREGMVPLYWALLKRNIEGFKFLLEKGANPNTVTTLPEGFQDSEASAMDMAASDSDPAYLRALLENGANPNMVVNSWNHPIIYRAIMIDRLENVKLFVQFGADINHRDKRNQTPIMYAVTASQFEIALFLLKQGADPEIENNHSSSPIDIVKKYGARGVIKGSNDDAAYDQFVEELRKCGFLKQADFSSEE